MQHAITRDRGLWAGRDSGLASLAGAVMMPVVGLTIALWSDVQLFGPTSGPIALADIKHHSFAARLRFTDARVATEFTGIDGARTWCAHGVFAHNLVKISALAA